MTNHNQPPTQTGSPGTSVKDPVCGMVVVPERSAGAAEHAGKMYYFCSKHCVQKFQADPERFLRAPGSTPMTTHTPLVQLGGVKSTSPVAEATVETTSPLGIEAQPGTGPATSYICPMDP